MADDIGHSPVTVADERAVVIGGTSGIGEAIAVGFAAEGADVIATSRTPEKVADTAEKLRDRGATTAEVTCDVTDRDSLVDLREAAVDALGGVDVLVNSSGAISRSALADIEEAEWDRVMDVQIDGVYRACQVFEPELRSGGSVVNVSSMTARLGMPNLPAYSAAKGGVDALTRAAAKEFGPEIRVNAVAPGFIVTPLNEDTYAEGTPRRVRIDDRAALERVGDREEVVGAVIYLASDAAGYTTGEILTVDGGFAASAF